MNKYIKASIIILTVGMGLPCYGLRSCCGGRPSVAVARPSVAPRQSAAVSRPSAARPSVARPSVARPSNGVQSVQNTNTNATQACCPIQTVQTQQVYPVQTHMNTPCNGTTSQRSTLPLTMQKLWAEHVLWTREYIISSVAGLSDATLVEQRLLQNQDAIGNAIVPFYGQENGDMLAQLLREHITIYAGLIQAALDHSNTKKVNDLYLQWQKNAVRIAKFLHKINPSNWSEKALISMLNEHLRLTRLELQLRLEGNWAADIANFNQIFMQALMMANELSDGIAKQFPAKF